MKQKIKQQLIANVLMDKCAQRAHVVFNSAWCSQERVIRFTTKNARRLFPNIGVSSEQWETGEQLIYEVENGETTCKVNCVLIPQECLQSWDITNADVNALFETFDLLLDTFIPQFEKELEAKLHTSDSFVEGEQQTVLSTKYERNTQARAACLEHYGYTCRVCGMNFEETYGPEFKGIIEVHHIVPLSMIGENYVVDPIRDLIPVCPNCHAAIHSKFGHAVKFDAMKLN